MFKKRAPQGFKPKQIGMTNLSDNDEDDLQPHGPAVGPGNPRVRTGPAGKPLTKRPGGRRPTLKNVPPLRGMGRM